MIETLPDARLVEIPGAVHLVPGAKPVECEAALKAFLRDIDGPLD